MNWLAGHYIIYDRTQTVNGAQCRPDPGDEGWKDHRTGKTSGIDWQKAIAITFIPDSLRKSV